jgi:hypothetical protein
MLQEIFSIAENNIIAYVLQYCDRDQVFIQTWNMHNIFQLKWFT